MTATKPEFDPRPSIRLTNTYPENPKVAPLSDAAFRLHIEAMCWCSRQEVDGVIPRAMLRRMKNGRPKVLSELVNAGLLIDCGADFEIHDYLKHQRSAEEIETLRESKRESGSKGAHMRWHVPRRKLVKGCPYCEGSMADE